MVNNSTNIYQQYKQPPLSPHVFFLEHKKKIRTCGNVNLDSSLGQAQKCGRVKPVKWDPKNA